MATNCGRQSFMQHIWHRLVGARGAGSIFPDPLSSLTEPAEPKHPNFGKISEHPSKDIARHKLVFLGEIHSMPPIISFQREIQAEMNKQADKLHVILEHFSFDLQGLLDRYMNDDIDFEQLVDEYHSRGEEGHHLEPYRDLLEDAKRQGVHLHAGFLPRKYARMLMKDGEKPALEAASEWLPENVNLDSSDFHYNVFESLLSGRSIYDSIVHNNGKNDSNGGNGGGCTREQEGSLPNSNEPSDQFRNIFKAQVLKDEAMAHRVTGLIKKEEDGTGASNEKFLVIAGNGHLLHYCGVPERVLRENPEIAADTCLVISENTTSDSLMGGENHNRDVCERHSGHCNNNIINNNNNKINKNADGECVNHKEKTDITAFLQSRFGREGSNPADFMYFYEIPEEILTEWDVKEETKSAYDKVGDTANIPGNSLKAAWIMHSLGYTEEQFDAAGPDVYNFQGVGNPHLQANIQKGDTVLDVGSGLGIDSTIACHATGPEGIVIGIDISEKETKHALRRAREQNLNAHFMVADMENMSHKIPSNSIDVVISNGAFCLAPNKEKAFRELYRVLKPGGRISVCTTTTQEENLEPGISWPLCMKMFIAKNDLKPLCEKIGFTDVVIDDSNSEMSMEIPDEILEESNPGRSKVHVGGSDFDHLEDYDMDAICARTSSAFVLPVPSEPFDLLRHHGASTNNCIHTALKATEIPAASPAEAIRDIKSKIDTEIKPTKRGLSASPDERAKIDSLVRSLEELCPYDEPARMPNMEGKWIVEYTTAPPPSNGKLGPFEGIARQIIDLENGTYVNYLSVPGDIEKEFLSAKLEATFEEWDGTLLKDDRDGDSQGDSTDAIGDSSVSVSTEPPASTNWFQSSINSIFQTQNKEKAAVDYGADSWKVDFKTLTIKLFGFTLIQKSFDEGTSRVWKMSYLDDSGTRIVRAGRTGKDEDAMLFYMKKE